jgi:carbamoyl-phosphate synthase small subunit
MKAIISTEDFDPVSLSKKLNEVPAMEGSDWVCEVATKEKYIWKGDGGLSLGSCRSEKKQDNLPATSDQRPATRYKVAAIDCGIKFNILRILTRLGCEVHVFPAKVSAEEISAVHPDGIFISNGPGDPAAVPYVADTVKQFFGKVPVFGICLGHQILGLALGGKTYKLKFGHHGANHPTKDLINNRIAITSQNHGFCVDIKSLDQGHVDMVNINLNDRTLEGMRHNEWPILSFQHHPEAAPGPRDARYLFDYFIEMMEKDKGRREIKSSSHK